MLGEKGEEEEEGQEQKGSGISLLGNNQSTSCRVGFSKLKYIVR